MKDVAALIAEADDVVVCAPDAHGRLMGKRRRASDWPALASRGLPMPDFHLITGIDGRPLDGFSVAGAGHGFRNGLLRPDGAAAFLVPTEPRTVHVMADALTAEGAPVAEAPRAVLRAQVARLDRAGIRALFASELEFYLLGQSFAEARAEGYRDLRPFYHRHGDNDVLVAGLAAPFCRAVEAAAEASGLVVDQVQGEGGAGQFEVNLAPAAPGRAADQHVVFKHLVKACAHAANRAVTFLAKPFEHDAGSGGHVHLSLRTADGANALGEGEALSPFGRGFLAGLCAHAPAFALLHAPYANSYKRLVPGAFTPLGATWGWDDRRAMLRLVRGEGGVRLELRLPGADANPYHAYAALIAAGLAGVEAGIEPGPGGGETPEDARAIPADLTEAAALFAASPVARAALGEAVHRHVLTHARHELSAARRTVSAWEVARGFEVA